jgi:hypothetical protein
VTTGRIARRLAALERRNDRPAAWRGVPVEQWPDHVLVAIIGEELGWPPGHDPSDAELRALVARSGEKGGAP